MTLGQIAAALKIEIPAGADPDMPVNAQVRTDSRLITQGDVFVALPGEHTDGNCYVGSVARRGAVAVITSLPVAEIIANQWATAEEAAQLIFFQVPDAQRALGNLARAHLAALRAKAKAGQGALRKVVGITGSAGKTTTKDLTGALASALGPTVVPAGSFNNEVGLPLTVLQADTQTQYLILEMGASAPGDLTYLTDIAPLDIAAVLMVGTAHLEAYASVDALAEAKAEILAALGPADSAILNADDPRVVAMSGRTAGRLVLFSATGPTAINATGIKLDEDSRAAFTLQTPSGQAPVKLQLLGRHHLHNALAAAAIGHVLGLKVEQIAEILSQTGPRSEHRMHLIHLADGVDLIDDSYNANPDSMKAALAVLGSSGENRRTVAVLGEMLELGPTSPQLHGEVGRAAASAGIDVIIGSGRQTTHLISAFTAVCRHAETHHTTDAPGALRLLKEIVHPQDLILIKGSHGSGLWKIAQEIEERGRLR